ncbi:hypothetical protein BIFDEN_00181 [Bifidobacterium dentium ATCC 27678]|nr:hypothetical protein BIFDEN_00181 [Bifidobacterium dentium ATCC 27678]
MGALHARGLIWDHSRRLRPLLLSTARLRPKRCARPLESVDRLGRELSAGHPSSTDSRS